MLDDGDNPVPDEINDVVFTAAALDACVIDRLLDDEDEKLLVTPVPLEPIDEDDLTAEELFEKK